jgi:hypothetical protein
VTQRAVGITDVASGAGVADYRTRERSVSGATVAEQYLIMQQERVRSFVGAATTFYTAVSATHVGSIFNAAGSAVVVALLQVDHVKEATGTSASLSIMRLQRLTAAPSGGVALTKSLVGTGADAAESSSADVTVLSAATADGVGTALTMTAGDRLAHLGQPMRRGSSTFEMSPLQLSWPAGVYSVTDYEPVDGMDPLPVAILRAGQGVGLTVDVSSSTSHHAANFLWEEYTLP